ncbi:MAG: alpha/beta hydrolase [Capsulimonadaceae bacterium]
MSISLKHRVLLPGAAEQNPPLLLLLHGYGSNEDDLIELAQYLDRRFLAVSVRAPLVLGRGQFAWFPIEFTDRGLAVETGSVRVAQAAIDAVIPEFVQAYDVDPARVFLMGFSQGAMLALAVALSGSTRIGGCVAMSGRFLPDVIPDEPAALPPIFVTHGTSDEVVPIASGRQVRDYLLAKHPAAAYREYPMGHQVSSESLADVASWLKDALDGRMVRGPERSR